MSKTTVTHKPEQRKKMTRSEAGRLGALALNCDPEKKRAATRKAAQTRKAKNPNCFIEIGRMGAITNQQKKRQS